MPNPLILLLQALQLYALFGVAFLCYPLIGALAARILPKRRGLQIPPRHPKLAVLIAASNEERVIAPTVAALLQQDYPPERFDVYVVADNCQDDTAGLARRTGATVYERFSSGARTKGLALGWLWSQVRHGGYDGVVVVDADNTADAHFLGAIAHELDRGFRAVQGLRRAKNDGATATAGLDALTELCTHRVGAAGRQWLGLNGPLMGSGVGYEAGLFDALIADVGETIVEDCEWSARLALAGTRICWTPAAVVYDEKTTRPEALANQRDRWMTGRGQVARAFLGPLLWAFARRGNLHALDMAGFLLTPPRSLTLLAVALGGVLSLTHLPGLFPPAVWLAAGGSFVLYVLAGLYLDGAPLARYGDLGRQVLQLPRFTLQMSRATWKALTGVAVKWVPTPHGPQS